MKTRDEGFTYRLLDQESAQEKCLSQPASSYQDLGTCAARLSLVATAHWLWFDQQLLVFNRRLTYKD